MSVPTVSKVINGRSDVSAETRRRVETAIREHGYQRSPGSRPRTPLLEVIFHELESEWALEIVRGVERVAGQHHLAVVLSEMQGRRSPGRGWIEGVLARRPTGVIAVFSDLSESMRGQLATRGIPYVVVDPTGEPLHDTPSIGATNWNGGLTATRHLLALGHRRIGVIGGPEWILCSRARLDGYRAAMDEAGVPIDPELISHGRFHVEEGIDRGRALLRLKNRPTAIFAGNDLQALGVYQAAREARLHIPEDLSVVGLRRPAGRPVGRSADDDRPPAADGHGDGGRRDGRRDGPRRDAGPDPHRALDRAGRPREHGSAANLTGRASPRPTGGHGAPSDAASTGRCQRHLRDPGRIALLDPCCDRHPREQLVRDHRRRADDPGEPAERRPLDEQLARRERQRPAVDASRGSTRAADRGCWRRRRR